MITVTFDNPADWPIQCKAKEVDPSLLLTKSVKALTATDEDLTLIHMELVGLPLPRHINEWNTCTWFWTDAQFIVANIQAAYNVNQEATR
jgi:hypothetical protein